MVEFSLELATAVAYEAHLGQVDKAGVDYINHPMGVMDIVQGYDAKLLAIVHDVVEDSPTTFEDLLEMGCPIQVVDALRLVTHEPDFDGSHSAYFNKIQKIADSGNQLAIDLKFADLAHNTDPTRINGEPTERDYVRWAKYEVSKSILRPLVSGYLLEI